jgi:hypothetical protein
MQVAGRLLALRCVVTHAMAMPLRSDLAQWTEEDRQRFARESDSQSKRFWDEVNTSSIFPFLSPTERQFATTTALSMSHQQQLNAIWRLEAAQVLMWGLHLIPELPAPDEQADLDLSKPEILSQPTNLLNSAVLRPHAEIDSARNLAELWHWRSRTEQLIREGRPLLPDEQMTRQGLRSYQDIVRMAVNAAYKQGDVRSVIGDDFGVKGRSYATLNPEEWSEIGSISVERHYALNWLCGYSPNNEWDQTPTDT